MFNLLLLSIFMSSAFPREIVPKETLRFQYVHEQEFDSSCGFSTVSSLLNIYWGIDTDELKIITKFIETTGKNNHNKNERDKYATTLLDLSKIISSYGIANKSFKMNYNQLKNTLKKYSPVLVHYKHPDKHFALVLSVYGKKNDSIVIAADPARGLEALTKESFLGRWSGVVLLTASKYQKINKRVIERALNKEKRRQELLEKWAW